VEVANLRAHEGGDLGLAAAVAADLDGHLAQRPHSARSAADQERVAWAERWRQSFLDLAQRRAAAPLHPHLDRLGNR
jgi:hypothetical protein